MAFRRAFRTLARLISARRPRLRLVASGPSKHPNGQKPIWHTFSFSGSADGWAAHAELIAFRYGNDSGALSSGPTPGAALHSEFEQQGPLPAPDRLHVRWRRRRDGAVLEDDVDLRGRLPDALHQHRITFTIEQDRLFVFVVTSEEVPSRLGARPLGTWMSQYWVTYEVYPGRELGSREIA